MRMELRWLTRGPFHDMNPSGTKYGDWLYRIVAEDQERRRYVGWIRWRPSRPWQSLDRWAVEWEDDSQRPSKGIGSLAFGALVAAAVSVPITLIAATVLQSH